MSIQKYEKTPLSPEELKQMYTKATGQNLKVIFLNKIEQSDTISDLFDSECFVCYVPVLSNYNGHFISFFKNENGIFFMDSYGNTPKALLNLINSMGDVDDHSTLFRILAQSQIPCFYNTVDYQSHNPDVADCGRYSVINCIWSTICKSKGIYYDLNSFNDIITKSMKENNQSNYDETITSLTIDL